jgi:hypothetical protein
MSIHGRLILAAPVVMNISTHHFRHHRSQQRVAVWAHGSLALGPLTEGDDEDELAPSLHSPISRTLAFLGAVRGNHYDEFDAVGLNRHRKTNNWQR